MKIAFLTHEPFYPPSGGGSAEAVYLVREMVRRGHEVQVFCPRVEDAAEVGRRLGVRVVEFTLWRMGRYAALRNFKYLLYPFFLGRMVEQEARKTRFDLLVSQHTISAVAAGKLRRRLGVPVVMNFLDYLTGFMETWPAWVMPRAAVRALKRFELSLPSRYQADGIMTVSDTLTDHFAEVGYPLPRIRSIFYGYDAAAFPFSARNDRPQGAPPVVVMHGSFDHHHLGAVARDALLQVHAKRPEVTFKFVGRQTGPLERFRRQLAPRAPGLRVITTGFVPYERVAAELAMADVGIVPYEESAGTHCAFVAKLVEYLGLGLPVVCTGLDNARRYFKDSPMVRFAAFNGREFGDQILHWLSQPRERWIADAERESGRVKAELDWQTICRRAVDFLETTAKR